MSEILTYVVHYPGGDEEFSALVTSNKGQTLGKVGWGLQHCDPNISQLEKNVLAQKILASPFPRDIVTDGLCITDIKSVTVVKREPAPSGR